MHRRTCGERQFLVDLAGVLMTDRFIAVKVFVDGVKKIIVGFDETFARARYAGIAYRHQRRTHIDQAALQ